MPAGPSSIPWDLAAAPALTVGIVSTYPPTPCGLATFSAALARGLHHPAEATAEDDRAGLGEPPPDLPREHALLGIRLGGAADGNVPAGLHRPECR